MSNPNPLPRTTADLEAEIAKKDRKIRFLEIQIDKLRERLEDLGEDPDEGEDEDEDKEETFDRQDHLQMAERLLELPASAITGESRQLCELWLNEDYQPKESEVKRLQNLYASCEREANLRGEEWL